MLKHTTVYVYLIGLLAITSAYKIDLNSVTTSGLSAGAFMAVQFHIAYSSQVNGSGILAGGPYYCAQGSLTTATTSCMAAPILLDVNKLISTTDTFAREKKLMILPILKEAKYFYFLAKKILLSILK